MAAPSPTREFYDLLQRAYDFFNEHLFDGVLPPCLMTAQREKNTMGFFSANRWASPGGTQAHEIALNPAYFAQHAVIEIFQTLVHEQCHLWQHEFGQHKSRRSYHNKEWAEKMRAVGLMPSHNGEVGGRSTGQRMSDYPLPDGVFLQACSDLVGGGFRIPWVDRHAAPKQACQIRTHDESVADDSTEAALLFTNVSTLIPDLVPTASLHLAARTKQKMRYHCQGCHTNLWGKPGLDVICGRCHLPYQSEGDSHEQQNAH